MKVTSVKSNKKGGKEAEKGGGGVAGACHVFGQTHCRGK